MERSPYKKVIAARFNAGAVPQRDKSKNMLWSERTTVSALGTHFAGYAG
jgi:hypothetical protein